MPEGPEVRKYADALDAVLTGQTITDVQARTRAAKEWLKENGTRLVGRRFSRVFSHGKHLLGYIDGGFYFHSHLMMWGRWQTFPGNAPPEVDRRERARLLVDGGGAILSSAPIFNVGEGDPYQQIENLSTLGPDVLPYPRTPRGRRVFDKAEFLSRLLLPEHLEITIGAALLNQQILAGLGNYLRAEVLFGCRLNPWRRVGELNEKELRCLSRLAPALSLSSYLSGATAKEEERERMRREPSLVYQPGREMGTRHLVFRRTNLPCLRCGRPIKQLRQPTYNLEQSENRVSSQQPKKTAARSGELARVADSLPAAKVEQERTRIVYFCPKCQHVGTPG